MRAYERKAGMSARGLMASAAGGLVIALFGGSITLLEAQATTAAKATANADVKADTRFIREVTSDNLLEVSLGKLAEQKAENSAVKQFGRRMETDHTKLQNDWVNMATTNGLTLRTGMGARHRAKLDRLQKLSGKNFDKAYMTMAIQGHKDDIDFFQKEGQAVHSSPVRDLVTKGLPVLQDHFKQSKEVGAQVGVDTTAALRTEHAMAKKPKS
jgi:putative membrane protein